MSVAVQTIGGGRRVDSHVAFVPPRRAADQDVGAHRRSADSRSDPDPPAPRVSGCDPAGGTSQFHPRQALYPSTPAAGACGDLPLPTGPANACLRCRIRHRTSWSRSVNRSRTTFAEPTALELELLIGEPEPPPAPAGAGNHGRGTRRCNRPGADRKLEGQAGLPGTGASGPAGGPVDPAGLDLLHRRSGGVGDPALQLARRGLRAGGSRCGESVALHPGNLPRSSGWEWC